MPLDSSSPDGKLRVLSLNGGGFRGLGMLYALDAIMKAANTRNREPTDPQLKPRDVFDYVIGTSAGGLVAVLIGRLGLDCTTAIAEYKTLASALFGANRDDFVRSVLAHKALDVTAYDKAIDALVLKYSPGASDFQTSPVANTKTAISITLDGKNASQMIASFEGPGLWTTKNLIRAATAAPFASPKFGYLPPFAPNTEAAKFIDGAYSGPAINPTAIALSKKYFDPLNVGVLVNIDQGFRTFAPPPPAKPLKSDATPELVKTFLGSVVDSTKQAQAAVLFFLKQIHEAQAQDKSLPKDKLATPDAFQSLDPDSVPKESLLDLADIFWATEIETLTQQWALKENAKILAIATKLVKGDRLTPPPQKDKIPYNPVLDAKKPKEMLQYLSTYHVIFIVDDSTSMILNDDYSAWDENRWNQAQRAIGPIAQFAFDKNVTNIDMGFMHYQRNSPIRGLQSANAVVQAFDRAKPPRNLNPYQNTPTGVVLDFHITKALDELDLKARTDLNAYKQIPPTDIILLTDGEADDDPKAVMQRAGKRLDAGKHNHNYIGIQIVQIGNSPRVAEKLADITKGEYGDMADLVRSNGQDLTYEKLARILLGGIHPTVRRDLRKDELQ